MSTPGELFNDCSNSRVTKKLYTFPERGIYVTEASGILSPEAVELAH
jgi:hypothetical protein